MPQFMAPPASAAEPARAAAEAAASGGRVSRASMRKQEATNWCWAAVTQSVLGILRNTSVSQLDVARGHLASNRRVHDCGSPHRTRPAGNCQGTGCSAACNAQHVLRLVLAENDCLAGTLTEGQAPSFAQLRAEIEHDRPVPCRVALGPGRGHFVLVTGWSIDSDGDQLVHVLDPLKPDNTEQVLAYAEFASRYRVSNMRGRINFSYKVQ